MDGLDCGPRRRHTRRSRLQSVATSHGAELIVIVEDEPVTRALFGASLRAAGFRVACLDGADALRAFGDLARVDLALLDIELPDGDGFGLAAWLRARTDAGIIFVSRHGAARDRVRGLELGGDDYVVKPPDIDELLARVRAVLRRRQVAGRGPDAEARRGVSFGGWVFDPRRYTLVSPAGHDVSLTPGEACVLGALLHAHGRVVARDDLRDALARAASPTPARSLDVIVHRLRKKLGEGGAVAPRLLLTVHGIGYRLGVEAVGGA